NFILLGYLLGSYSGGSSRFLREMGDVDLKLHALGNTPLNSALLVIKEVFWKFKNAYNLDIVHVVCVTDGSSDAHLLDLRGYGSINAVALKNGPFVYNYNNPRSKILQVCGEEIDEGNGNKRIIDLVKDETGCKVVSFFL